MPPPPDSDGSAGQGDGHPAANFLPTKDHGIRLESSMAPAYLAYTFRNLSSDFLDSLIRKGMRALTKGIVEGKCVE